MQDNHGPGTQVLVHPRLVRLTHWVNALCIVIMVMSGWRIFNASPLFDFTFPKNITMGAGLAGATQWHFAAMWLLVVNGLLYLAYGLASGRFRKRLWPVPPGEVVSDVFAALRGRLSHEDLTVYNAAQRAAYLTLILSGIVLVLSGLAIWKPVQLQELTALFGGYDAARYVHFFAMAILVLVVAVHVAMVVLVPRTFPSMITGRVRRPA